MTTPGGPRYGADARRTAERRLRAAVDGYSVVRDICEQAAESLMESFGAAAVTVSLREGSTSRVVVNVGQLDGDEERFPDNEVFDNATEFPETSRILSTGRGFIENLEAPDARDELKKTLSGFGFGYCMGAPLIYQGVTRGELLVLNHSGDRNYIADDVELLRDLGTHLAFVLAQASEAPFTAES